MFTHSVVQLQPIVCNSSSSSSSSTSSSATVSTRRSIYFLKMYYFLHQPNPTPLHHLLLITFSLLLFFQNPRNCQAQQFLTDCPASSANYTSGSKFESNLKTLLIPTLISNGPLTGFYNSSITGNNNTDTVYGLAQCRGDISREDCKSCLNASSVDVLQNLCPNKIDATVRYENCLLRYSNVRFFSQVDNNGMYVMAWNTQNVSDQAGFSRELGDLLNNLSSDASSKPSKFQTGSKRYQDFSNIYGLVQCTQDLSTTQCDSCLQTLINYIPRSALYGKRGGKIFSKSCVFRYEDYVFYDQLLLSPPPPPPPPPTLTPPPPPSTTNFGAIVGAIVGVIIGIIVVLALCVCFSKRKKMNKAKSNMHELSEFMREPNGIHRDDIDTADSLQFDLHTIKIATNNFSDANKLGQGGFGAVYKGELLDKQKVAVKRLSSNSGQGSQEFKNEVVLLHRLQHRNLVKLLGFCLEEEETILIYEYVQNLSLDKFLLDPKKKSYLDWKTRYKIIGGIARGLLYLHEDSRLRIIHRDLKAGNILLDEKMNAKIADFGTAKHFGIDQTQGNTSRIAGTFGYMAPEYVMQGLFSVKSDVYSFGVLLLEIVSGLMVSSFYQSDQSQDHLLSYAWKHWREGTGLELIDPTLKDSFKRDEVMRCIHIGLLCVQENIDLRPTMSTVVLMLSSYSYTLSVPTQPAFCAQTRTGSASISGSITYSASEQFIFNTNPR